MLTNFNGKTITYDEIGNPIKYLGDTLTWTEGRRLSSLSRPYPGKPEYQTIYTYKYNAAGQRTSKTKTYSYSGESITTEFIYEGDLLVGQKTSDGKGDMTFLHDDTGAYIGLIYEGVEYYYMKNVQGDIIGIVDAEGVIQAVYTYEPFGKLFSIETKSGFLRYDGDWSVGGMNPIRYRGYYYDYDTKLYYLNSRYYDPYVGRFLNADGELAGIGGDICGYNLFSYCFNNPVNMSDASGTWPSWSQIFTGIAIAAVAVAAVAVVVATAGAAAPALAAAGGGIIGGFSAGVAATAATVATGAMFIAGASATAAVTTGIIEKTAKKSEERNNSVYVLKDDNGAVQYVGRTKNVEKRRVAHNANKARAGLRMEVIASGLNLPEARALEQAGMAYHHTLNTSNKMNNQINSIAPKYWGVFKEVAIGVLNYGWNQMSNEILYWTGN